MTNRRFFRCAISAFVVFVLLASACTTGDDETTTETTVAEAAGTSDATTDSPDADSTETSDTSTETTVPPDTTPVERTASFRGVTEDEIQIGVGFWDTSVFGFGFYGEPNDVWAALTDAVNADGGVNGRSLVPTVAGFSPADPEGMLAACIALTEDAEVFAVLGGMRGDANFCVFEQHETIHIGSQISGAGEAIERARAPIAGFFPDGSVREAALINALDEQGWFDGAEAVGVHYENNAVAEETGPDVEAALAAAGVDIALELNLDDLGVDEDTLEAQVEIMQEQVRSAGVDRMLVIGQAATALVSYGELGIQMAAVDSDNFTTAVQQGIDPADLDGTIATALRVNLPADPVDDVAQKCLDDAAAALPDARFERPGPGVENSADDPNYYPYTVLACRDLQLFIAAATAAGVELTNDSFQAGLESLSELALPEMPFLSYGPGKYNGGDTFRLVEFDADADEDGELVPLGDPIDLTP